MNVKSNCLVVSNIHLFAYKIICNDDAANDEGCSNGH